jgi:hypothetical protein
MALHDPSDVFGFYLVDCDIFKNEAIKVNN